MNDEGLAEASSVFPPPPRTVHGAILAGIARNAGWRDEDGPDRFPAELQDTDKFRIFGPLPFAGPMPQSAEEILAGLLLPLPAHVRLQIRDFDQLVTGVSLLSCEEGEAGFKSDLDIGVFCQFPSETPGEDRPQLLTSSGMRAILRGQPPFKYHLVADPLSVAEPRIGIARDASRHAALDGMLYLAARQRPVEVYGLELSLLCDAWHETYAGEMQTPSSLGGDARFAWFDTVQPSLESAIRQLDEPADDNGRYAAILLTPSVVSIDFDAARVSGLNGRLISICNRRPVYRGGWETRSSASKPSKTRLYMPAGTVFFMSGGHSQSRQQFEAGRHSLSADEDEARGFGMCVFGKWPSS